MTDLKDLLARVEGADSADREIDCELYVATAESPFVSYYPDCVLAVLGGFSARLEIADIPKFTASVDAALALVERQLPGFWLGCQQNDYVPDERRWSAWVQERGGEQIEGIRPTLPLAILAALLMAKISL